MPTWGTRTTKIFRDIVSRRTRTALVSLSVFVGVLGVVVLTTLGTLITRQLEKDLVPSDLAMLRIFVETATSSQTDNAAVLQKLRDYPGITQVEGQAVYEFAWKRPGQSDFQAGLLYAYSEPFGQIHLEPVRLIKGRYPVEGQDEIAIEQRMARAHGLTTGDTLVVQVNGNGERTLRIVGIVFQPYMYIGGGDGTTSAYATYANAQQIVGFSGFSSIYIRFGDFPTARQQSHSFRKWLMSETPYRIIFYLVNDPQDNIFLVGIRQFTRVLLILALVAMVVASFLVTTVISNVMAEHRHQIGAMKALGATRVDILKIYLGMAVVYGLIGTIPAVGFGAWLGQRAALAAAPVANTVLENVRPPLSSILLGFALGIGVPLLAAAIPVIQGSRVTILEAMTDQGIVATYGKGLLPWLVQLLPLPAAAAQAVNNILRHKSRLALTALTLTFAVAAFMGVFAVFRVLNGVVGKIQSTLNYQVSVDPASINVVDLMQTLLVDEQIREIQPDVAVQLQALRDGVTAETPSDTTTTTQDQPETTNLYVTGIDTAVDLLNIPLTAGTGWNDDPARSGIVITSNMADEFHKTVGDMLHLIAPNGEADFEIIGICDFPFQTAFMEWQQLADFVGVIRDAPVPNAYWEPVQVSIEGDNPYSDSGIWAVGIDERVGRLLLPSFRADQPGVIVSQALATAGGFVQGGTISLHPPDGTSLPLIEGSSSVEYPILAVLNVTPQELRIVARDVPQAVLDEDQPALVALYWPTLADLVHLDYRKISPETFYIDLANPQATLSSLNHTYTPPKPAFQNQVAFEDRIAQMILSLGLVMGFTAVLMAIVGGIGLLTIMSISVFERQREIGVMRSVGASSLKILEQFLLEGFVIGLCAWGAGVPLSYALSQYLVDAVPFSGVLVFKYTLLAPVCGLAGILILTGAATLYPALAAARKTVAEILHYQ
jgi:putative ABC transport system permease protein